MRPAEVAPMYKSLDVRRRNLGHLKTFAANIIPAGNTRRFCILTTFRTGSELLVDLLNDHPKIRCQGEIMNGRPLSPYLFARGRVRTARMRGLSAYGFKLLGIQLMDLFNGPDRRFIDRLAADGFVFIHLRRRDLFWQAISTMRAVESGVWHRRTAAEASDAISLDVPDVYFQMRQIEIQDVGLDWLVAPHEHRTLWYEDHLESDERQQATVDEICRMLEVDTHTVSSTQQRNVDARVAVANLDEIKEHVKQTRFAHFLD